MIQMKDMIIMIKDDLWVNIPKNYGYNGFTSKIDKVIKLKLAIIRLNKEKQMIELLLKRCN